MNRYRIIEMQNPHEPIKYRVDERIFGKWGWWVESGYAKPNYWVKAVFKTIEEAEDYIKEHSKPKLRKIIKEL